MKFKSTSIPDVFVIEMKRIEDERGVFMETYKQRDFKAATGVDPEFVQDNFSLSKAKNTIRGLHFQAPPFAQGKLVRCLRGSILDVAVDIRIGSPTFLRSVTVELSQKNAKQLWIPEGFLHGFRTLAPDTEVAYKCTQYYSPEHDGSILWNDAGLAVDWGMTRGEISLSDKDNNAARFSDFDNPFYY